MVLAKTLESPLDCKEIQPVNPTSQLNWNQSLIFIGRTDAEAETPILWPTDVKNWHWKRPWCWERFKVGGEGDDRGWDGWMTSLTQWTWVWASSGSWWYREAWRPVVHGVTKTQTRLSDWTELNLSKNTKYFYLFLITLCAFSKLFSVCFLEYVVNANLITELPT